MGPADHDNPTSGSDARDDATRNIQKPRRDAGSEPVGRGQTLLLDSDDQVDTPGLLRTMPAPVQRRPRADPAGPGHDGLPRPGDRIHQYEIIRELGRGGMGAVYLARDIQLARRVAIKFLLSDDRGITERFIVEARATARCRHENIVVIYEVNEHQGYAHNLSVQGFDASNMVAPHGARGMAAITWGTHLGGGMQLVNVPGNRYGQNDGQGAIWETGGSETRPVNMSVVWIMRVK